MEPAEFAAMVRDIHDAVRIRGQVTYELTESEKASTVFRRSVFAVQDIQKGEQFTTENIRCIRPGYGTSPKYYMELLGKPAKKTTFRGSPLELK